MSENVGLLLKEPGYPVIQDMEATDLLISFFTSVITSKTDFQESQVPETTWRI